MPVERFNSPADYADVVRRLRLTETTVLQGILRQGAGTVFDAAVGDEIRQILAERNAHVCHAEACNTRVVPELLMCRRHWLMVPVPTRRAIIQAYAPGQCYDHSLITKEWAALAREAIDAVARKEGRR